MIENYKKYLNQIYQAIKSIFTDSKIFLFGSILSNDLIAGSDIDILIIANVPKSHLERANLIADIEKSANLPLVHPFEFHILSRDELQVWKDIYNFKYEPIHHYL